jgi:hypothetical protein
MAGGQLRWVAKARSQQPKPTRIPTAYVAPASLGIDANELFRLISSMDASSPLAVQRRQLWHIDAVDGRLPHRSPLITSMPVSDRGDATCAKVRRVDLRIGADTPSLRNGHPEKNFSDTCINAGPASTMNSAGRIKTIMGTVNIAGRRAAFSSAVSSL